MLRIGQPPTEWKIYKQDKIFRSALVMLVPFLYISHEVNFKFYENLPKYSENISAFKVALIRTTRRAGLNNNPTQSHLSTWRYLITMKTRDIKNDA